MDTSKLRKFAQFARRTLIEQVSTKLKQVLAPDSRERREAREAVEGLESQIKLHTREGLIEKVAYTWFNRFCALRYMDLNRFTTVGVVSPLPGQFQPEILAEAKQGHIDVEFVNAAQRKRVQDLLNGSLSSPDPQGEAYRLLFVESCNDFHRVMPYLFARIDNYDELLLPDDLLSGSSILAYTCEAMTPEACENVEVIGWLYQYYISEKKDEVFENLKKGKKINPDSIPAATQLFTPHWIVRYLVENSLGRLWLLNRPQSKLAKQMDYYIPPEVPEIEFLHIQKPEDLKVCDPACGSGHMLTYAFDLLYAIYEEEGYEANEIPEKILTHNLYGIEIDERAAELAALALTLKAREKYRRFFRKPIQPQICVLKNVTVAPSEVPAALLEGLSYESFAHDARLFAQADHFGSLLVPHLKPSEIQTLQARVSTNLAHPDLKWTENTVLEPLQQILTQADYLSAKYPVVIANPPYMGGKGMNGELKAFAQTNYPDSKSDFFAMFIERGFELVIPSGYSAMVTMQSWMFLSSYEALREKLCQHTSIACMAHMANMVMGIAFGTAATVWKNAYSQDSTGYYCFVEYENIGTDNKPTSFPPLNQRNKKAFEQTSLPGFFRASAADFKKIPGSPIAYWVSEKVRENFVKSQLLEDIGKATLGMNSTNNNLFVRHWFEIYLKKIDFNVKEEIESNNNKKKWFPYNKGGEFRRWYGNNLFLINWENNGFDIHNANNIPLSYRGAPVRSKQFQFRESITWSFISSSNFGVRYSPPGFMFDVAGSSYFTQQKLIKPILGFLASKIAFLFLKAINPTLNFQVGNISSLPFLNHLETYNFSYVDKLIHYSKKDWDSYETSWDFSTLPLLNPQILSPSLETTYRHLHEHWQQTTQEMRSLEEDNNRIFIEAYGLQDELKPDVPIEEITLTCNPAYRYGGERSSDELEEQLKADTMREFISYAVGCMFGRYSLDQPGLILANQGEGLEDYLQRIPEPTFAPDADNVIPILDGDWFTDDIVERFDRFLKLTFGEEQFAANRAYIEAALGKKGKPQSLRDYFLKDFYADHLKRYKKRPIYWLFSSPKGSFNALIYMHRYRPDTVSVILNDYLRDFIEKVKAQWEHEERVQTSEEASKADKSRALKEAEKLKKIYHELKEYEREILYPLATQKIEIDLDDGVKVNYLRFGMALKKIPGLEAKED